MSFLALGEVIFVFAVSLAQYMSSEEEYLENIYIYKTSGETQSIKEERVWEFLNKSKLHDPAITLKGIYRTDLKIYVHTHTHTKTFMQRFIVSFL